jgi:hypothetical protein
MEETRTRTLVKLAPPSSPPVPAGDAWEAFPVGTVFEYACEEEVTGRRAEPEKKSWTESWTVREKGKDGVRVEVKAAGGGTSERTLPLVWRRPESDSAERGSAAEHRLTTVDDQPLETPLGRFDCVHVATSHSMIDAGGRSEEWRAPAYPVPLRTVEDWGAKQTVRVTTRTLARVEKPAR